MTLRSSATVGERSLTRVERSLFAAVLVLTALAGVGRYVSGIPHVVAFILAALALAGLAWTVSFSTEQIGMRYGPAVTGTLQSTVGNLPEFFVVIFALQAHDTTVAETALIGSILVNALLVLGMVLIAGARQAPDGVMRFSQRLPNDTATLLLASSLTIVLIGVVTSSHEPASHHVETISIVGAVRIAGRLRDLDAQLPPLRSTAVAGGRRPRADSTGLGARCVKLNGAHPAGRCRCRLGVRVGLVRQRTRADDPPAAHLAGLRGNRDRRDRG